MTIILHNVDLAVEATRLLAEPKLAKPPWKPFDKFLSELTADPREPWFYFGYSGPSDAARSALAHLWLRWHLDRKISPAVELLTTTVKRGLLLHRTKVEVARQFFDYFMVLAAILTGDRRLMTQAAKSVWHAGPHLDRYNKYQMHQSLTGVLKFRIRGDARNEHAQYRRYSETKKDPFYPLPGKALLDRFIKRDYTALNKVIAKDAEKYTRFLEKRRRAARREGDTLIYDTYDNPLVTHPWPFVEAAIAKLAILDGAEITHDSLWFPLALVKHGARASG